MAPLRNEIMRKEVDKNMDAGIITPSRSAWSFPIVIVSKKDGKLRFYFDYRTLDREVIADRWPLLKIKDILEDLQGSDFFTSLDIFGGWPSSAKV